MRQALTDTFGHPKEHWSMTEGTNSRPRIDQLPPSWYCSLSHSKGLVAFSMAQFPNGIDVELNTMERNFSELAEQVFCPRDITLLESDPANRKTMFYRIWCAKEAWYKALPTEVQQNTRLKALSYIILANARTPWVLYEGVHQCHQISLVACERPRKILINRSPTGSGHSTAFYLSPAAGASETRLP
ncbi:4'-phosphopantetheinyl transferase family protein [Marinobacterium arenosum]|uniref:4'-phosphopantetheinyl transferase family protein n=1 Tax=Marinobacterium arenosum TaxID=2862496 RepID=UPI0036F32A60